MYQPLISIIIPIYNAEPYIKATLNNLLKQTLKEIEIITIDDGSSDTSLQIIKQIANTDNRIRILQQQNSGPGKARQLGLNNATGKYIMFCDSDDFYKPDMCKKMLSAINNNNVEWAVCDAQIFPSEDYNIRIKNTETINYNRENYPSVGVGLWCYIFKKSIIQRYNITFPNCFYGEDINFILKYIWATSNCHLIAEKLYMHRKSATSLMGQLKTSTNYDNLTKSIEALFDLYDFLISNKLYEKYKTSYLNHIQNFLVFQFHNIDIEGKQRVFDLLKNFLKEKNITSQHSIIQTIIKNNFNLFCKYLEISSPTGVRRIKILNITIIKIKETITSKKIYLFNIPIYIKKWKI